MYSAKSYELTVNEYNYLLAPLRKKLSYQNDKYYFIGNSNDLDDMLDRLKGFYDCYIELSNTIKYKCFINGNLIEFRKTVTK